MLKLCKKIFIINNLAIEKMFQPYFSIFINKKKRKILFSTKKIRNTHYLHARKLYD